MRLRVLRFVGGLNVFFDKKCPRRVDHLDCKERDFYYFSDSTIALLRPRCIICHIWATYDLKCHEGTTVVLLMNHTEVTDDFRTFTVCSSLRSKQTHYDHFDLNLTLNQCKYTVMWPLTVLAYMGASHSPSNQHFWTILGDFLESTLFWRDLWLGVGLFFLPLNDVYIHFSSVQETKDDHENHCSDNHIK